MEVIADLHIHSKYSRAVSQQMTIPKIWEWAKRKGIDLVATGDWTHPLWMREIKQNLEEIGNGLLKLKINEEEPYFLLSTEISSIYSQGGRLRRIHNLVWTPSIATAEKINKELIRRGANLIADGRPILGLTSIEVAELVFSIDPACLIVPAHVWTPWFSLYGSESGFDSIGECFGNFSKYIYAIETGLSSSPAMNWRIKELDNRSIVSFSDAHSGSKLGREATVFELEGLSYENIRKTIMASSLKIEDRVSKIGVEDRGLIIDTKNPSFTFNHLSSNRIVYTIEFYPEEGKYHFSGHRTCGVKQSPSETKQKGTICPVCGKKLTIGVAHRVEQLAGRSEEELGIKKSRLSGIHEAVIPIKSGTASGQELSETSIQGIFSEIFPNRPPYVMLVPLLEILADSIGMTAASQNVQIEYKKLTDYFGGEFKVLLEVPSSEIAKISGSRLAEAIHKVRTGDISVDPGYDGVFGVVKIWPEPTDTKTSKTEKEQLSLF